VASGWQRDRTTARAVAGRVLVGLLAGSGLWIAEALALRWRNVDLATGTLHVNDSWTQMGTNGVG
jgi:integrase